MKLLLPIFLFLVLFTACKSNTTSELVAKDRLTVKLGAILPISGPVANMGSSFQLGLKLGMDSIPSNTKFKYELVIEDDQLNPSKVASATQKLINQDSVQGIISTWSYGGNVVAPIVKDSGIPHFSVAWDPEILKSGKNNYLNLVPPREFLPLFFKIFKSKGYKSIALAYFAEAGSVHCANEFKKLAKEYGIEVVIEEEFSVDTDLKTIALKFKNAKPEIIFANIVGMQLEVFIRNLKTLGYQQPITTITGFDLMSDLKVAEGFWYISDSALKNIKIPDGQSAYGVGNYYDFIQILVQAFEAWPGEGLPDSIWVNDYIQKANSFVSAFGNLKFDQRQAIYPVRYFKILNGERVETNLEELMS